MYTIIPVFELHLFILHTYAIGENEVAAGILNMRFNLTDSYCLAQY